MNIVATIDKNFGIGKGGNSLVSIPREKVLMREETLGKVIVLGRKTFEKLNNGQALYGRINIVFSKDMSFMPRDAIVVRSKEEFFEFIKDNNINEEDIFILGGKSIFDILIDYCELAHICYVDFKYEADTYIKNLDEDSSWEKVLETEEETYFDLAYNFVLYKNNNKKVYT